MAAEPFEDEKTPMFVIAPMPGSEPAAALYSPLADPGGPMENSGVDLRFAEDTIIPPGPMPTIIGLGIKCRCLFGGAPAAYHVAGRSSIGKTALSLANGVALFDKGYTGEVRLAIRNNGSEPWPLHRGDSLFQAYHPSLAPPVSIVASAAHGAFQPTARGAGGFGSTGRSGAGGPPAGAEAD